METDDNYRHLDAETVEAMAVMLDMPEIWEEKENYIPDWEEEEDDHDMCYAVQKWREDDLARGRSEGLSAGLNTGIKSLVEVCEVLGASIELTVEKLIQKFSIDREAAEEYVLQYRKQQ